MEKNNNDHQEEHAISTTNRNSFQHAQNQEILEEDEAVATQEEQADIGPRKRKRCKLCPRTGNKTCNSCKV